MVLQAVVSTARRGLRGLARLGRAGRRLARVPARHAHADHVGGRHGRRRGLRGGARPRGGPPAPRPTRSSLHARRHRAGDGRRVHRRPRPGRAPRSITRWAATGGALAAARCLLRTCSSAAPSRTGSSTSLSSVVRGTGNMALPASVMVASGAALPGALARADPRLGAVAPPRGGGRGRGERHVVRTRQPRAARLSSVSGRSLVRPALRGLRSPARGSSGRSCASAPRARSTPSRRTSPW